MTEYYENGPKGMPRVKRMTDSTLGWVASPITLLQLFQAHPGGQEALNQFAHAVAEETLARVPAWPAVPQASAEQPLVEKLSMSMVASVDYLKGWNDCVDAIAAEVSKGSEHPANNERQS